MKKLREWLAQWRETAAKRRWDMFLVTAGLVALLSGLSVNSGTGVTYNFREGDLAPYDIRVPRNIEIVDRESTAEKVQRIRGEVLPVFTRDPAVSRSCLRDLRNYLDACLRIDASTGLNRKQKLESLGLLVTNIPAGAGELFLSAPDRKAAVDHCVLLGQRIYTRGYINPYPFLGGAGPLELQTGAAGSRKFEPVSATNLFDIRTIDFARLAREEYPAAAGFITSALSAFLRPDITYDVETTARRVDQRLRGVKPVLTTLRKGQVIVSKGEEVTAETLGLFDEISLKMRRGWQLNIWGVVLFYGLVAALMFWGIRLFEPRVLEKRKYFYVLALIVLVWSTIALVLSRFDPAALENLPRMLVLPLALPALALSAFFGLPFTVFALVCLTAVSGFLFQSDVMDHVFILILSLAVLAFRDQFRRRDRIWLGGLGVLLTGLAVTAVMGLVHYYAAGQFGRAWALVFVTSVFSVLAAMGLISLLEISLNLATDTRLMELCNLNKPIFRRMSLEAPGTYHHSVLVANLAEAAALEIGANSLLAKAAAYYHDIGKLEHPDFFAENAGFDSRAEEVRKDIKPSLYVSIVKQHLKESVEMGRKLHLPEEVLELVGQHHGKGLIKYFYLQALNQGQADDSGLSKEDYVYPSENPRSREAVVLLLADSVEAASRSVEQPSYQRVQGLVEDVINSKFAEGILGDSAITLGEIQKVGEAFIRILMGFFHSRVKYPADAEVESAEQNGRDRPSGTDGDPPR